MKKKYHRQLNPYAKSICAISPDRFLEGMVAYGLFCEKLPPILSSHDFYCYCQNNQLSQDEDWKKYIYYESMRNINSPRAMAIPNPFGYYRLCKYVADHFSEIQDHFRKKTDDQKHRISRIHIRLMRNEKRLFLMNYDSGTLRKSEDLNLQIGKTYRVKADIATCFPSIYSHALAWALVGKLEAKKNTRNKNCFYNKLDEHTRNLKFGETKGILIGPHISNLLSEIVLVAVDYELKKYWDSYVRHIDDYTFFAESEDDAHNFIRDLNRALHAYNLQLNSKKTCIEKLPIGCDDWVHALKHYQYSTLNKGPQVDIERISVFTDYVVDLLKQNSNNLAIMSFAMKIIAGYALDNQARQYYINLICNLAIQYPYIVPYLDKYLFIPFDVDISIISLISSQIYKFGCSHGHYECVAYALFFAIKYKFKIESYDFKYAKESQDCIFLLMSWLYSKRFGIKNNIEKHKEYAKELIATEDKWDKSPHSFWLYWYEVLNESDLPGEWKKLKNHKVSFLLPLDTYVARMTPNLESVIFNPDCCSEANEIIEISKKIEEKLFSEAPVDGREQRLKFINSIISNIYLGYATKSNVVIYRTYNAFWKNKLTKSEFKLFLKIVDLLRDHQFLGEKRGKRSDHIEQGYGSRFWAKEKLFLEFATLNTSMIKNSQDERVVILRYKNKKDVPHFKDSPKSAMYRGTLTEINQVYQANTFSYTSAMLKQSEMLYPRLKSIFNNRSWEKGGRLYSAALNGISYQNISENERGTILINGQKTVELDYSSLHITMLYAKENATMPDAPYDMLSRAMRALVKVATLILINANSDKEAVGALRKQKNELEKQFDLSEKNQNLLDCFNKCTCSLEEVVSRIKSAHSPISKYFGSGVGLQLQNEDSLMALEIVHYFAQKGLACLPVHDSFIVQKQYENELRQIMLTTFAKYNNNYKCKIKRK